MIPLLGNVGVVSAQEPKSSGVVSAQEPKSSGVISAQEPKSSEESNNTQEEIFRSRLKAVGQQAIRETFDKMRQDIVHFGKRFVPDSRALTSEDILKISNIGKDVIAYVKGRKTAVKAMILETAKALEEKREVSLVLNEAGLWISSPQITQKAKKLSEAFGENRISLNSLVLAIQATFSLSKDLHNKAIQENDPVKKYNLYLDYTAFVYEMSSIVIETIEDFTLGGVKNIRILYDERLKNVNRLKQRIEESTSTYQLQLQNKEITEEGYKLATRQYFEWLGALNMSLKGWDSVFSIIDQQEKWADSLQEQLKQFKKKKNDADIQLDILVEIGIAKAMLNHLEGLKKLANLELPELLILDEKTARQLLGLEVDVPKKSPNIPILPRVK